MVSVGEDEYQIKDSGIPVEINSGTKSSSRGSMLVTLWGILVQRMSGIYS